VQDYYHCYPLLLWLYIVGMMIVGVILQSRQFHLELAMQAMRYPTMTILMMHLLVMIPLMKKRGTEHWHLLANLM